MKMEFPFPGICSGYLRDKALGLSSSFRRPTCKLGVLPRLQAAGVHARRAGSQHSLRQALIVA